MKLFKIVSRIYNILKFFCFSLALGCCNAGYSNASNSIVNPTKQMGIAGYGQAKVVATTPSNNATNISVSTKITVTYNYPIDPSTVNSNSFYVTEEGKSQKIAGKISITNGNQKLTFTPYNSLSGNKKHTIKLVNIWGEIEGDAVDYTGKFSTKSPLVNITTTPSDAINVIQGNSFTINAKYESNSNGTSVSFANQSQSDNANIVYSPTPTCNLSVSNNSCTITVNVGLQTKPGTYVTTISGNELSTTSVTFTVLSSNTIAVESLPESMHLGSTWTDTLMNIPVGSFGLSGYLITNQGNLPVNTLGLININPASNFDHVIHHGGASAHYEFWIDGPRSSCYELSHHIYVSKLLQPQQNCSIVIHYEPKEYNENGILSFTVKGNDTENIQQTSDMVNTTYSSRDAQN